MVCYHFYYIRILEQLILLISLSFHPKWVNTVGDLRSRRFGLGDIPALVYPFCSESSSLGNWLGIARKEQPPELSLTL